MNREQIEERFYELDTFLKELAKIKEDLKSEDLISGIERIIEEYTPELEELQEAMQKFYKEDEDFLNQEYEINK